MDVDNTTDAQQDSSFGTRPKTAGMDIDSDNSDGTTSMFATRTKPAMNKYQQKRLGAKKAKKLEIAINSSFVLNPIDARQCIEHSRPDAII